MKRLIVAVVAITIAISFTPSANSATLTTIYKFTYEANPRGPLTSDTAGSLYGAAARAIFKLTRTGDGTWTESNLYTFTGNGDGFLANPGLIFDSEDTLYGTTQQG
jgi:hypothetical protein